MSAHSHKKRKSVRYKPDSTTIALLECEETGDEFEPQLSALVFSEADTGCGLVVIYKHTFEKDQKIRVAVGKLRPLRARIAWVEVVGHGVQKIGVEYLE